MKKRCRWCGALKALGEFYRNRKMADGRLNKCKDCVRAYQRRYWHDTQKRGPVCEGDALLQRLNSHQAAGSNEPRGLSSWPAHRV